MTNRLAMHLADDAERIQAFENVHEFWDGGRTLEEHLAWRLQSPQHLWADWYVGCLEGRVVTSLGAYPLLFHVGGRQVAGFAIGAVHTVPDGAGFSTALPKSPMRAKAVEVNSAAPGPACAAVRGAPPPAEPPRRP